MGELEPGRKYGLKTRLVRGGLKRSENGETSEALYLTSGYAYDSPESAEARFKGEEPGFMYSRFGNPTVAMFEERMALIEGAPVARATATGMAAVTDRAALPPANTAITSSPRARCSAAAAM